MLIALDIETACNVPDCKHYGRSLCAEGHSLSPWHGRITKLACWAPGYSKVVSGEEAAIDLAQHHVAHGNQFVAHNGKFDMLWLSVKDPERAKEYADAWAHDTQLLAFVHTNKIPDEWLASYEANRPKHVRKGSKHSLKTLAPYFLGVEPYWEPEHGHEDDAYVLKDVEYTYRLFKHFDKALTDDEIKFVYDRLLPWAKMCLEAELRGLKLDVDGLLKYKTELEERAQSLKNDLDYQWSEAHIEYRKIQRDAINRRYDAMKENKLREQRRAVALSRLPEGVSYDSPAQMKWLLSEYYGLNIQSLEGDESTGKEVLNRLAEEGHHGIKVYLDWRKTQKLLTAFIPTLLELRDQDDVIHPIFNITGARTGRTSSERPNAQQIPKDLKRFFKPRQGKLVGYDQSAIEAKLIAAYTEDPVLMDIIKSGESIHNVNTKTFFGLDCQPSDVPKLYAKERKASKNCGFALFYNAGANRIRIAFTQAGFPVSQNEARRMHRNFLDVYSVAMQASREIVESLEQGEVVLNLLGRPIRIERPEDAYMQGFNTLVQSSASDINLDRMHTALTELRTQGYEAYPLLTIHDYAGIEVVNYDDRADEIVKHALQDLTLQTSLGDVKLEVEGGVADEWN